MIEIRATTYEDFVIAKELALDIYMHTYSFEGEIPYETYVTMFKGNAVLGLIGTTPLHEGVYHIYAILTKNIYMCPISFVRFCKKLIRDKMSLFSAHRAQMDIAADYQAGHRWATALGFTPEGVMKKYGYNKTDHVLYARVL